MVDNDNSYQFKSVKAMRFTKARTIAKWESQGWELDRQTSGPVRTELVFRRVKPKVSKRTALAVAGSLVAIGLLVTVGAVTENDSTSTALPANLSETAVPRESNTLTPDPPATKSPLTAEEKAAQERAEKKAAKAKEEAKQKADAKKKVEAQKKTEARKRAEAKQRAAAKRQAADEKADAKVTFDNCMDMNRTYSHGVGKPGAADQSSGPKVTTFTRSRHIYDLNSQSDRDGDGIACEKR